MKNLFFILGFLLMTQNIYALGSADWVYLKDQNVDLPIWVSGTRLKGKSNVTEPSNQESKFLRVENAGVVVLEQGVGFFLNIRIKEKPQSKFYITVEYPNPLDSQSPLINDVPYDEENTYLQLSSPDFVKGLAGYGDYDIKISVYKDKESMELIDSLVQPIRTYIDTREENPRIFKKVLRTIK